MATSPIEQDETQGPPHEGADDAPSVVRGGDVDNEAQSPFKGLGALLEESDEKKIADTVVQMVRDQAPLRKRHRAEWECAKAWVRGVRGVKVRRNLEDVNDVELVVPLGAYDLPPIMDRSDELCEKTVSHLLADPPVPEAEPATDSDSDRDSAEFTTRLLIAEGAESGYNNLAVVRRAERKACVFGSGFVYPCVDPTGGGWRPMEIRALETATTVQDATLDPESGAPVADDDERLETRYVMESGQLTDDSMQAKRQWLPKIKPEVLTGESVVLLPPTCSSIADAVGTVLIRYTPLGKLKGEFPDTVGKLNDDQLRELIGWHPDVIKRPKDGSRDIGRSSGGGDKVPDTALVCTLSLYFTSHYSYPKGAYIVVANPDVAPVLHRQPWAGVVESSDGDVSEECLSVPLAQFRQFDDDVYDDPFGYGLVWKIGPADEARGEIIASWLDYIDRFGHPNMLYPMGSNVDVDAWERRDGSPIYFNPQGQPVQEEIPSFPPDGKEFLDRLTQAQDSASGLEETAQGADSPNVTSGIQAQTVIQQAHVNLATVRANMSDGQERLWRIIAQLIRVFYTIPQTLKYQGEDGAYKRREWSRADLGSTKDIRIARGSFTQQSPEQKQSNLDVRYQAQLIDADEYERLSSSNLRASTGIQDNPHRMRVRQQISAWRENEPEREQLDAAMAAQQQQQMAQQAAAMQMQEAPADPMAQAQPVQAPPMEDPLAKLDPFADMRPVDDEQDVAAIRHRELRRELAGSRFAKAHPMWKDRLVAAYTKARQAAGVATVAEQQQAAAQQAQMQADQAAQQQGAQSKDKSADRDAKAQESDAARQFQAQSQDSKQQHELEREAMRAQGAPLQPA